MGLKEIMHYADIFVGVMLALKTIIIIINEILKLINRKYYKVDLKKRINLLNDTIGVIDKPISVIIVIWFIISLGIAFVK